METPVTAPFELELPGPAWRLLKEIIHWAPQAGISRLALVGGAVRDGLRQQLEQQPAQQQQLDQPLGHPRSSDQQPLGQIPDLDVVVEGSAIALAQILRKQLGEERITQMSVHRAFDTVGLVIDGLPLDLASARQEIYPAPGENPRVSEGPLEADLARRDFTVNAIAFDLDKGELLDPHAGCAALQARQLLFLHGGSVADDPTRVIRGSRYAARLGFDLAPEALQQLRSTLRDWPWTWRPGQPPQLAPPALASRLGMELALLMEREPWQVALAHLQHWGALPLLDARLQADQHWRRRLHWARRFGVPMIPALLVGAGDPLAVAARLQLADQQQRILAESLALQEFLSSSEVADAWHDWTPARWCEALEGRRWRPEAVALTLCSGGAMWHQLLRWLQRWRHVRSPLSAQQLLAKGWLAGPDLGAELRRLRVEQVNRLEARRP